MSYDELRNAILLDKARSGDYIMLCKWDKEYEEMSLSNIIINIHQKYVFEGLVAIHKKHKNILDAYFSKKVIEFKFNDEWVVVFVDFVYSYNRDNEHRIKETQDKNTNELEGYDYTFYKQSMKLTTNYEG